MLLEKERNRVCTGWWVIKREREVGRRRVSRRVDWLVWLGLSVRSRVLERCRGELGTLRDEERRMMRMRNRCCNNGAC